MLTEELNIKYTVGNNQVVEPRKGILDSADHDVFAAEEKSCSQVRVMLSH